MKRPTPATVALTGRLDSASYPGLIVGSAARTAVPQTHTDLLSQYLSLVIKYTTEKGDVESFENFCITHLNRAYSDRIAQLEGWGDIRERPLTRAREQEAQCPLCERWYSNDQDVKKHWARHHEGTAVPSTFPHHSGKNQKKKRRRRGQEPGLEEEPLLPGGWTASQVQMERTYEEEMAAVALLDLQHSM